MYAGQDIGYEFSRTKTWQNGMKLVFLFCVIEKTLSTDQCCQLHVPSNAVTLLFLSFFLFKSQLLEPCAYLTDLLCIRRYTYRLWEKPGIRISNYKIDKNSKLPKQESK